MAEECTYERIPQEQVAEILENVVRFRSNYDQEAGNIVADLGQGDIF